MKKKFLKKKIKKFTSLLNLLEHDKYINKLAEQYEAPIIQDLKSSFEDEVPTKNERSNKSIVGCSGLFGPATLAPTSTIGHDINVVSVIVKPLVDKILGPIGSAGVAHEPDLSSEQKDSWQKYCKDSTVQLLKSKLNKINYHLGPTGAGSMEYETLESSKSDSDLHKYNFEVCFQYLKDLMEDNAPLLNPDMEELIIKLYASYITYNKYFAFYSFLNSERNKK